MALENEAVQETSQPADTTVADLTAAFDAAEVPEKPGADEKPASNPVSEAARTLAKSRSKTKAEPGGEDKAEADHGTLNAPADAKTPAESIPAEPAAEAPAHWSAADRETFKAMPAEAQKFLLARHKAMEGDYTQKSQEIANFRRQRDALDEMFRPYAADMNRQGIDMVAAVRQFMGWHAKLQADPQNSVRELARAYGVDLDGMQQPGAQPDGQGQPDPRFNTLTQKISQLESTLQAQLSAQQQSEQQANLNKVEQFAAETDPKGQPAHPHFDDVAGEIRLLLIAAREAGTPLSLQDAYDRAVYANPQVRVKVLAAQDAERRAREAEETKAKANAARSASFEVKGQGAATAVVAKTDDVHATLAAAFDAADGRV